MNQPDVVAGLQATFSKLDDQAKEIAALKAQLEEVTKERDHCRRFIKDRDFKIQLLEKSQNKVGLDAVDEEWLFSRGATITFKRRFGGGRVLTIRAGGKVLSREAVSDKDLVLVTAMKEISERQRPAPKQKQGEAAR
jgi:hypothetical protein